MTPNSTFLTLLIAAHESNQSLALAEMIRSIRPRVHVLQFSTVHKAHDLDVAMVVEPGGPELDELSKKVRAAHPDVPLVVIAPRFDERAIEVAAGVEAAAIIASPCEPVALLRVLNARERKVRFPGRCGAVETSELLRLHAAASSNGILHVASGSSGSSGAIHLEDGQ